MRHASSILFVILLVGCGAKSTTPPAASTSYLTPEPIPPAVAALMEQEDHDAALAKIDELIAQRPTEPMLYSIRSSIHHRRGDTASAIADLNKAIELSPRDPRLFNNRGFVLMGVQKFPEATADFDRATELAPDYANPFNNRGLLLIARGHYASAVEQLDQALRLDPNYVDAYNNRGFAAFQAGNADAALTDFNRALKLNPKYVNAFNNRGLLRAGVGDLENAILDFTNAMMLDPLNPKYYEHRCEIYRRKSAMDLAVADENRHDWLMRRQELTAAIHAKPGDCNLLILRASHHLKGNDSAKALDDVQRALKIEPQSVTSLVLRGRIYLEMDDFQNACRDAVAALKIEPTQDANSLRGDACLGLKDYDQAIESFAEARRIDNSVAEAYYRKAQVLQASGQQDAAADTLKQAVALDPHVEQRLR